MTEPCEFVVMKESRMVFLIISWINVHSCLNIYNVHSVIYGSAQFVLSWSICVVYPLSGILLTYASFIVRTILRYQRGCRSWVLLILTYISDSLTSPLTGCHHNHIISRIQRKSMLRVYDNDFIKLNSHDNN